MYEEIEDKISEEPSTEDRSRTQSISSLAGGLGAEFVDYIQPSIIPLLQQLNMSKLDFIDQLSFMCYLAVKSWKGFEISIKESNYFINIIREQLFYSAFPLIIEEFRKLGEFELSDKAFYSFAELLKITLTGSAHLCDVLVPQTLMLIGGTYYLEKEGRVYLSEGIKSHNIFKRTTFWETCLLYKLHEAKNSYNFHSDTKSIDSRAVFEGYKESLRNVFYCIALQIKDFGMPGNEGGKLLQYYYSKLDLGDSGFENVLRILK